MFIKDSDAFAHGLNERVPVQGFYDGLELLVRAAEGSGGTLTRAAIQEQKTAAKAAVFVRLASRRIAVLSDACAMIGALSAGRRNA